MQCHTNCGILAWPNNGKQTPEAEPLVEVQNRSRMLPPPPYPAFSLYYSHDRTLSSTRLRVARTASDGFRDLSPAVYTVELLQWCARSIRNATKYIIYKSDCSAAKPSNHLKTRLAICDNYENGIYEKGIQTRLQQTPGLLWLCATVKATVKYPNQQAAAKQA